MSSAITRLHNVEISSPVLRSSTSDRVNTQPESNLSSHAFARGDLVSGDRNSARSSPTPQSGTHSNGQFAALRFSSSPRNAPTPPPSEMDAGELSPPRSDDDPGAVSPGSSSAPGFVVPVVEGISDDDVNQVEMFYRSQQTQVHVCRSLTNMYLSGAKTPPQVGTDRNSNNASQAPHPSDIAKDDWDFSQTGIPVLVLDTGEHRRGRKLRLVLAEKGTGFTLWQDEVNQQTRYRTPHTNFHTVTISTDISRLVGFSFDEGDAATEFAESFRSLLENQEMDMLNAGKKKPKKKKEKKPKFKLPKKIDISQPCCFVHVTKLERPDLIGGMFPPPPNGVELSRLGIPRAASESSGISESSTNGTNHSDY